MDQSASKPYHTRSPDFPEPSCTLPQRLQRGHRVHVVATLFPFQLLLLRYLHCRLTLCIFTGLDFPFVLPLQIRFHFVCLPENGIDNKTNHPAIDIRRKKIGLTILLYAGSPSYLLILFSALSAFAVGGLSIERNQKPLAPEITLAVTHHDRQKQVEVKRSSRVNPHEIRLFSGCPYAVVK